MDWTKPLLFWYRENARRLPWRETREPYRILVSEIMLQQTRVNAVLPYYDRFLTELPTLEALAEAEEGKLYKLWEGLGYYSRARNLRRAAAVCCAEHGGALPADYESLLALPGLGEYTAGAVASIAFGIPVPAVDGNVLRVLARLQNDESDIVDPKTKKRARAYLLPLMPRENPGELNQALMELGAIVCVPNGAPKCEACPLAGQCRARAAGRELLLPVKSGKKPRRIEEKTVFALLCGGRPLVYRRAEGVLKGLWQLPEAPGFLPPEALTKRLTAWGLTLTGEISRCEKKHVFTHIEWRMRVYRAEVSGEAPEGLRWLTGADALPTAYRICLPDGDSEKNS